MKCHSVVALTIAVVQAQHAERSHPQRTWNDIAQVQPINHDYLRAQEGQRQTFQDYVAHRASEHANDEPVDIDALLQSLRDEGTLVKRGDGGAPGKFPNNFNSLFATLPSGFIGGKPTWAPGAASLAPSPHTEAATAPPASPSPSPSPAPSLSPAPSPSSAPAANTPAPSPAAAPAATPEAPNSPAAAPAQSAAPAPAPAPASASASASASPAPAQPAAVSSSITTIVSSSVWDGPAGMTTSATTYYSTVAYPAPAAQSDINTPYTATYTSTSTNAAGVPIATYTATTVYPSAVYPITSTITSVDGRGFTQSIVTVLTYSNGVQINPTQSFTTISGVGILCNNGFCSNTQFNGGLTTQTTMITYTGATTLPNGLVTSGTMTMPITRTFNGFPGPYAGTLTTQTGLTTLPNGLVSTYTSTFTAQIGQVSNAAERRGKLPAAVAAVGAVGLAVLGAL